MNRLRQLRKEANITQEGLATMLHVKRSAISKYETGIVPLTDALIIELAKIFNVTADYILGRTDIPIYSTTSPGKGVFRMASADIDLQTMEAVEERLDISVSPGEHALLEKFRALPPDKRKAIETLLE